MEWQSAISNHPRLTVALESCIETLEMTLDTEPNVLFAFVSPHHRDEWEDIGHVLRKRFPQVNLIGCSGAGIIGAGHEVEGLPAISLTAAALPGVDIAPFYIESGAYSVDGTTDEEWRALLGEPESPQAFVLLPDPFSTDTKTLVGAIDRLYPESVCVGAMASGGREPKQHYLVIDGQQYDSGCVGLALSGNIAVDTIVAQGCQPIGPPMFVTRVDAHTIYELDGRPALDVLEDVCKSLSPAELALAQKSLYVGLAMERQRESYGSGDYLVRDVVGAVPDGRALVIAARARQQSVMQFHVRDARAAWQELDSLADAVAQQERPSMGGLMFTCLGRGQRLYGEAGHDSRVLAQHLGELPLGGFFGNGEIGPVGGVTYIHGYTTAVVLFRPSSDA